MKTDPTEHPLCQTFAHVRQLHRHIQARYGEADGPGWVTPLELFTGESARLQMLIERMQKRLGTEAKKIICGALLQEYQWPLLVTSIACFLIERRVPDMCPESVRLFMPLDEQPGAVMEQCEPIAYCSGRFAALSEDPAADHPSALIVADVDALRVCLRRGIEMHMGWVIQQLSRYMRCNERGLWLYVTDRCAGTLCWLMQQEGSAADLQTIEREFDTLLRAPGSPLNNNKVGLFTLTYRDHTQVFLNRATCCYWYRTEGGDYCANCPHRSQAERHERLLQGMASEYEKRQSKNNEPG